VTLVDRDKQNCDRAIVVAADMYGRGPPSGPHLGRDVRRGCGDGDPDRPGRQAFARDQPDQNSQADAGRVSAHTERVTHAGHHLSNRGNLQDRADPAQRHCAKTAIASRENHAPLPQSDLGKNQDGDEQRPFDVDHRFISINE
jgi:hypothetical protein